MAFEICEILTRDDITISYDIIMIDYIYTHIYIYIYDTYMITRAISTLFHVITTFYDV